MATKLVNNDHSLPFQSECGQYEGAVTDEVIEIGCLEDNTDNPDYGYGRSGYAVHVQFATEAEMQSIAICRIEIELRDSMLVWPLRRKMFWYYKYQFLV